MSESPEVALARSRADLGWVWELADATLRTSTGDVADLAWATMEALAWAWGGLPTAPVTHRTLDGPSAADVRAELGAGRERMAATRTPAQYARLRGAVEALAFALGDDGPFWWSDLAAAFSARSAGTGGAHGTGSAAAR